MTDPTPDNFLRGYTALVVSRKILGMWFKVHTEYYVSGDDRQKQFQSIRDIFQRHYGEGKIRIRVQYPLEVYDF